jgi:hypothetical protein
MPSSWTKAEVKKWVGELHGGDYSEHTPKFLKMDGERLLSLSRDDFKEIVGPVDGIVMYKAICAACTGILPRSSAAQAAVAEAAAALNEAEEEAEQAAEDAAEETAVLEAVAKFEEAEASAAGEAKPATSEPKNPMDTGSQSEPTEEEFEAIKKRSAERREAKLLAKRRPHHSAFTNSVFWNMDYSKFTFGTVVSVVWSLLWPVWMRPSKGRKDIEGKWDQKSGTGAY